VTPGRKKAIKVTLVVFSFSSNQRHVEANLKSPFSIIEENYVGRG
jgi:hypothetical protein